MLKVLIVDDEPFVREGLKHIIPWEEHGFTLCGEGVDGKDGLNKTLDLNPDVLLVDIKMPGYNGLELLERARQSGFNGKVIILTGYSDFKYAQQAIYLSVKAYILKPIDEDELLKVILELKDEIATEKQQDLFSGLEGSAFDEFMFRKRLLSPANNPLTDQEQLFAENEFKFIDFNVVLFETNSQLLDKSQVQALFDAIREFCKEHVGMHFLVMEENGGMILNGKSNHQIMTVMENLGHQVFTQFDQSLFIVVGKKVEGYQNINESLHDAKGMMSRKFFYSDHPIVLSDQVIKSVIEDLPDTYLTIGDKVYTFIEICDSESINHLFNNIENLFRMSSLSTEKMKGICVNCYVAVKEKFSANYSEHRDLFGADDTMMDEIYSQPNLHELLTFMKETFISIAAIIANTSSDSTMKRILNYIHKNYYKDLKLEALSELFCYNSAYLGKMFKNQMGQSFNEYLEMVRIDHAKRLLESDTLKVYEVSQKVGYKNVDYFYSKFKKYVNTSPKEYQKDHANQGDSTN